MVNFSITIDSFSKIESLENTIKSLVELGINNIELSGDPSNSYSRKNLELFNTFSISVLGVTGKWTSSKGMITPILLTSDPQILSYSKNYIKECIKMCNFFGGSIFNVCLLSDYDLKIDWNHEMIPNKEKKKLLKKSVSILSELTSFSKDFGVYLLLEPLNRYSTPFCSNAADAIYVTTTLDNDYFAILLDTYHMNIEETDFSDSITKSKNFLKHIHFADNNRKMPGLGHINFDFILKTLKMIQYNNYIGLEPIVDRNYKVEIKQGLYFLNKLCNKYQI
ncbi:MAG TPA: sugar phosphate isomerase/epimerase family protein [Nitrososphaeraceae archaeon]|nr:sugar phosphate isomerase/epimerase family protein [Nitrososphaeraceae archaeon]